VVVVVAAACRGERTAGTVAPTAGTASTTEAAPPQAEQPDASQVLDPAHWTRVAAGSTADAWVEQVLYERAGSAHFFVHVALRNHTARNLGVVLAPFACFYPNQWGPSDTPHRQDINERRLTPKPLDDAARAKLVSAFRAGAASRVPAEGALDYFSEFNASTRADVEAQERGARYVIVVMDGRADATDGTTVERVAADKDDDSTREVTIDAPVPWGTVPASALAVIDR
jgi:hypothetical protein